MSPVEPLWRHGGASAHPNGQAPEARGAAVRFLSADELRADAPAEPPWCWHGYLAAGALTLLAGKPKAGKSTLALALALAVADGASAFLEHAIEVAPVVYVSEEGAATLAHKVAGERLRIATRETAWPRPAWPALIDAARAEAERVTAGIVIVDTFAFWAALGAEREQDAGAVQAAMEPLYAVARAGRAVLLVAHSRKGGGDDGDAVRGSSALAGAVDIVLELERVGGESPRQRKLLALSRYPQTPGVLVIEHDRTTGRWSAIGEGTDRGDGRDIANRAKLLEALSSDEWRTRKDLEKAMGAPHLQWCGTLEQLTEAGVVAKAGEGKKGDPNRYKKLAADAGQNAGRNGGEADSDNAAPLKGQHQNHDAATVSDSAPWAETAETTAAGARGLDGARDRGSGA